MDAISTQILLRQFDNAFESLIFDCDRCYNKYRDNFNSLYRTKSSYSACLKDSKIPRHSCLPIMLGSAIDLKIRGSENDDPKLHTLFIVNGAFITVPYFMTNNIRSGHVWHDKKKNTKCYKQTFGKFKVIYSLDTDLKVFPEEEDENDKVYMQFVRNKECYKQYFKEYMQVAPDLDDLANKTLIQPARLFKWGYEQTKLRIFNGGEETMSASNTLANTLRNNVFQGNLYFVLSKKSPTKIQVKHSTVFERVPSSKLGETTISNVSVKRNVNEAVKNSKVLVFPKDGMGFICPLHTKEMRGAGEVINLSLWTIASPIIDNEIIINWINAHIPTGSVRIFINGIMTHTLVKDKTWLINLKKYCSFVGVILLDNFIHIQCDGNLPMKYSIKYGFFVTPYEATHIWPDALHVEGDVDKVRYFTSNIVMRLPNYLLKADPTKLTVSLNNIKGECLELSSQWMADAFFKSSIGTNAALLHSDIVPGTIIYSNTEPPLPEPIPIKIPHEANAGINYLKLFKVNEFDQHDFELSKKWRSITVDNSEIEGATFKYQNEVTNIKRIIAEWIPASSKWTDTCKERNSNQTIIYCIISDFKGAVCEDALVVDTKLRDFGPRKIVLNPVTVSFTEEINSKNRNVKFKGTVLYVPYNTLDNNTIHYGVLFSKTKLVVTKSSSIKIEECTKLSNEYRYCISQDFHGIDAGELKITSEWNESTRELKLVLLNIIPAFQEGAKIANLHGQKGLISTVTDLSSFRGYTKDGTMVTPGILISEISVIGRLTASQLQVNEYTAFTPDGIAIFPLAVNIHSIDSTFSSKIGYSKIDQMTRENGFQANKMPFTDWLLSQNNRNSIHAHRNLAIELVKTDKVSINVY